MGAENQSIIGLLRGIESRARANAHGLPQQLEVKNTAEGIGFRVGDATMVAHLGEVSEILTYPTLTRIPGAKAWVRGLANVRGNLLPVLDLHGFLLGQNSPMRRNTRVLIVQRENTSAGFLVNEVLGMRHFFEEDFTAERASLPEFIREFSRGIYRSRGEAWGVIDFDKLLTSEDFVHVAA